jgi:hypothetical protein
MPDPPAAVADTSETKESRSVTFNVMTNDNDPDKGILSLISTTQPKNGTLTTSDDGRATYTPAANFIGGDSFSYTIRNASGLAASALVKITVLKQDLPI